MAEMSLPVAPNPLTIVRELFAFIKHPVAMRPSSEGWGAHIRPLLVLLAFNIAVLFTLLPLLELWNKAVGITTPKLVLDKQSPWLVLAVILILPPLEEIVFRGWQTGKPWQVFALLTALAGITAAVLVKGLGVPAGGGVVLGLTALVALVGVWRLRKRQDAPGWFVAWFRWIFWAAALAFAAAHYSNYTGLTLAHAPLVLPQLWAGLVLGFVRLRFGLTRSMALHVSSNAMVIAISAVTGWAGA